MAKANKKKHEEEIFDKVKTFKVPLPLEKINQNINIDTSSIQSKDEIINQAIQFHSEGNISKAEKYYKYCLEKRKARDTHNKMDPNRKLFV